MRGTLGHLRLALLPCLLLLTACGLEIVPYLSPPDAQPPPSATEFSFRRTTENSEIGVDYQFEGFELYYRFYTTDETPNESIIDRSGLLAAQFRRVCGGDDTPADLLSVNKPLIRVTLPGAMIFTLKFGTNPSDASATSDPSEFTTVLRREPRYSSTHPDTAVRDNFKSFAYGFTTTDPYLEGDRDVGTAIWGVISTGQPSSSVRLALYVLSYGRQDYVTDLYSDAVYLGYRDINFGW